MLVVRRLYQWSLERLWRLASHYIMHILLISPASPSCEQSRQRVRQTVLERRYHDAARAALHALHVTEHERRGDGVRLTRSSPSHNDRRIGTDKLCQSLRVIEINPLCLFPFWICLLFTHGTFVSSSSLISS